MQLELDFSQPKPVELLKVHEIFEVADERILNALAEDRRFEKKSNQYGLRQLGHYFSMWANTTEGGLIAVGIRNNNEIEGCAALGADKLNKLEKTGMQYCPDAQYKSKRIPVNREDGTEDFIILFQVDYHPSRAVKTTGGKYFKRVGDSCIEIKPEDVPALREEKGEIQFETKPVQNLSYPEDFDENSIREFCETVRDRKGWNDEHSVNAILELMRLGKIQDGNSFVPNIACALLFANDVRREVPGARIRFLRFEGETEGTGERWNAVKDEFVEGTVPQQISRTAEMLSSQLRTFSRLDEKNRFFTTPEYPAAAWYEAIVNACVHRSYGNGQGNRSIFVKMFDDRLVIESPGPFPPLVTPQNIYDSHSPRNPFLMDAMYFMEFVRCAHEGTRRIRETMQQSKLPHPEFIQDSSNHLLVRVVLRNNIKQRKVWVDQDVSKIIGDRIASELSSDSKRCLNYIAEYGQIGVSDAQRLLNVSWPKAKKVLERLRKSGIVDHDARPELDRDPKARYRLSTNK